MYSNTRTQSGGALLIAMILLFMISIMGISVMQSSTLEHRMATNAIESKAVFQSAESVTDFALNNDSNITAAFDKGVGNPHKVTLNMDGSSRISSNASLEYVGGSIVPGSSIGLFEGLRFEVRGKGLRENIAGAGVAQGAVREVPAN